MKNEQWVGVALLIVALLLVYMLIKIGKMIQERESVEDQFLEVAGVVETLAKIYFEIYGTDTSQYNSQLTRKEGYWMWSLPLATIYVYPDSTKSVINIVTHALGADEFALRPNEPFRLGDAINNRAMFDLYRKELRRTRPKV